MNYLLDCLVPLRNVACFLKLLKQLTYWIFKYLQWVENGKDVLKYESSICDT